MKSYRKTLPGSVTDDNEEIRPTKDYPCLISITAWLNFLLSLIYWLKIDFLNYWISRPLHWWEKRESAFALSCFILCTAFIHTFLFARGCLKNRRVLCLRENQSAKACAEALLDKAGNGEVKQQGDGVGLAGFGFDQRNARS